MIRFGSGGTGFAEMSSENETTSNDQDKLFISSYCKAQLRTNSLCVRTLSPFEDTQGEFTFGNLDSLIDSLDFDSFSSQFF